MARQSCGTHQPTACELGRHSYLQNPMPSKGEVGQWTVDQKEERRCGQGYEQWGLHPFRGNIKIFTLEGDPIPKGEGELAEFYSEPPAYPFNAANSPSFSFGRHGLPW